MKITIPELSLVVLIGASGAGKSSFARKHFLPTESVSSDFCRALVSDDENSLDATNDAFEVLHFIAGKRLSRGQLVVVDATNVQPEARKPLLELARKHHVLPVAIVFDLPEKICQERNEIRPDRNFGPHVVRNHIRSLRRSLRGLGREGFRHVYVLQSPEDVANVQITRQKLWNNRKDEHGPFDIIGDVHGCCTELESLLRVLDYENRDGIWQHAEGRKAVFVGDLVDRGPRIVDTLKLVMAMCESGNAICVPGNHDVKLLRKLRGKNVKIAHGLQETLDELERESDEFREQLAKFLDGLISHYVFDDGKLVVAHAGLREEMHGRASGGVREFALYGETTGETDEFGLPIRYPWANEYRGKATVVYGHTPIPEPEWLNNTVNIDTGCVFGGKLTGLRYPERELVSVPAEREYSVPIRPLIPATKIANAQQQHDDVLDIADVTGKRLVETRLGGKITIREENSIAALEVMSRFAADPKWLIYLPPTMSPSETSTREGYLEHPAEALNYYRERGVEKAVCEEKHMGSRAVVTVCRDSEVAAQRFGVQSGETGIVYTRTGRRFFDNLSLESQLLEHLRAALEASNFWNEFNTNWVCLDCELMPWSAKAQELLSRQYAPVGAAANASLQAAMRVLERVAASAHIENKSKLDQLSASFSQRHTAAENYVEAYRRYCWDVSSIEDYKLAPFHVLATEGQTHFDKDHIWHMETIARFCAHDSILLATPFKVVDLNNEESVQNAIEWWEELTSRGGEGMVVKSLDFIARGERGLIQSAVKCRGREYLRIIYGPEYDLPGNIERLRKRGLSAKRGLALREFALGIEGLERFVAREPLRRVHECVFGVLASESEPVDPRL